MREGLITSFYLHDDPELPAAWAPWFSHEYLAYFAVRALDGLASLPTVPVKPDPRYGRVFWPVGPKHVDLYKESYRDLQRLDPLWTFDYRRRNGDYAVKPPAGKRIEPWKVVVIYSTEPDLDLDCDLNLHKNQTVTGGSHGWRHMQFRLLGSKFGIARESFRTSRDFARLAFENGNDYWGWRHLSRATHYLADLGNPFHVKALPLPFLIRKLSSSKELFRIVSAVHQGYEIYVERRFREGFPPFKQALMEGAREGGESGADVQAHLGGYVRRARKRHDPIFRFFLDRYGEALIEAFGAMDRNSPLDAAAQTNRCSAGAARVLFGEAGRPALDVLDGPTAELLFDVGRMLGMLLTQEEPLRAPAKPAR